MYAACLSTSKSSFLGVKAFKNNFKTSKLRHKISRTEPPAYVHHSTEPPLPRRGPAGRFAAHRMSATTFSRSLLPTFYWLRLHLCRSKDNRAPQREDREGDRGAAFTDRQLNPGSAEPLQLPLRAAHGRFQARGLFGGSPGLSGSVYRPDVRTLPCRVGDVLSAPPSFEGR